MTELAITSLPESKPVQDKLLTGVLIVNFAVLSVALVLILPPSDGLLRVWYLARSVELGYAYAMPLPVWLAALVAGVSPAAVGEVFVVVNVLALGFMLVLARRLGASRLAVVVGIGLFSPLFVLLPLVAPEATVTLAMLLLHLLVLERLSGKELSIGGAVVVGITCGLLMLSSFAGLLAIVLLVYWLIRERLAWKRAGLIALATVLIVSLGWLLWNAKHEFATVRYIQRQLESFDFAWVEFFASVGKGALLVNVAAAAALALGFVSAGVRSLGITASNWRLMFVAAIVWGTYFVLDAGDEARIGKVCAGSLAILLGLLLPACCATIGAPMARLRQSKIRTGIAIGFVVLFALIGAYSTYFYKDKFWSVEQISETSTIRSALNRTNVSGLKVAALWPECAVAAFLVGDADRILCLADSVSEAARQIDKPFLVYKARRSWSLTALHCEHALPVKGASAFLVCSEPARTQKIEKPEPQKSTPAPKPAQPQTVSPPAGPQMVPKRIEL